MFICFASCFFSEKKNNVDTNNPVDIYVDNVEKLSVIDSINIGNLVNNKWSCIIAKDCINIITFTKDGYEEDNCEWNLIFRGKYHTSKDTIFLTEYGLASELPGEHRIVKTAIYTYLYQTDSLKFICNKKIEHEKVVSIYYPNLPVYFKRELN
jgi:hypothetical protein